MHYLTNLTALYDEGCLHTLAGINQIMMYGTHGKQRWNGGMSFIHATVAQDDVVVAIIHALGSLLAEFIQSLVQSFFALGGFEEHVEFYCIKSLVADILKDIQLGIGQDRMCCPVCGAPSKRETNTMPQWAGSSWYFLRYVDNHNSEALVSREKADKYLPVDMYIGGVEHAVLHLLYSRFYTKFLCDIGVIDFDEPFKKLFNQGMITGKNGIKMSKSKGNVVSPDDLVRDYGCDSLRLYELFVGPPEQDAEWDDRGIEGVSRFLNRFWNLVMDSKDKDVKETKEMVKLRHKLVYDIEQRFNQFSLNTVISGFMEYNNKLMDLAKKEGGIDKETLKTFVILLAPFAPHIGEELWSQLGGTDSVFHSQWPECDTEAMKDDEVEVAVQVNGKTRAVISVPADISKEDAIVQGKEAVKDKMAGNIVKEIYVPGKIINIVCK